MVFNPMGTSDQKAEELSDRAKAINDEVYARQAAGEKNNAELDELKKKASNDSEQARKYSEKAAYNK